MVFVAATYTVKVEAARLPFGVLVGSILAALRTIARDFLCCFPCTRGIRQADTSGTDHVFGRLRTLLRAVHARGHEIGIHPGYNTYKHPEAPA